MNILKTIFNKNKWKAKLNLKISYQLRENGKNFINANKKTKKNYCFKNNGYGLMLIKIPTKTFLKY